jgi:hypothetical protein
MNSDELADEYAVKRVRQIWAFARDHGEWETMRACFYPEATVRVAWYSGPVAGFLEETIASAKERVPGEGTKHWFGNSRAWVKGDRALLETDAQVLGRQRFAGHMFDFTLFIRLYDRLERRAGKWKILRMDAIYDRDRLDPVLAGTLPPGFFDGVDFSGPQAGLALMKWRLGKRGGTLPADLPLGGTESEKKLRVENEAWLASA